MQHNKAPFGIDILSHVSQKVTFNLQKFDDPVLLRTVLLDNAFNAHWATSDKNRWLARALLIWLHHTLGKRVHTLERITVTNLTM